jgi:hypothetical protein
MAACSSEKNECLTDGRNFKNMKICFNDCQKTVAVDFRYTRMKRANIPHKCLMLNRVQDKCLLNIVSSTVCFDKLPDVPCNTSRLIQYPNGTCYNSTGELIGLWNPQLFNNVTGFKRTSASEEYYE